MKQYEIWWADLPKPAGRRPVMLLSRNDAYEVLNKYLAVEITTTIRHIPIEMLLGKAEGMSKPCVANFDNLRTISKTHLAERIARIPARRIHEVKQALGYALAWEELIEARV
ncbi:MAG: type II toxin-antitoxin system PemK/MazF family toxin [Bryobacterales bacterium]|nr:type II toxin-antitoxin system PemK/MazF family toxin [Bryobacterales bacterium]